ncbi:hypothetical protein [Chitinimonas lacunae]|uniref:Uncharacterized protein n=1 Tax=Chitinimonas lacunae TaxID=1963018 RepID=A0ABV8MKF8_9NEIS
MQYYSWSISDDYPERLTLKFEGPGFLGKSSFTSERRLNLACPIEFSTRYKRGREHILLYDQVVTTVGLAVSPTFAELIIEELSDNEVELLDTLIVTDSGRIRSYRLVNILNKVDVLDERHTQFVHINGVKTASPHHCVYDLNKLRGFDIGRVNGCNTILLSENFVLAIKHAKLTGFSAHPLDPSQISSDRLLRQQSYATLR